jgi:cytochrome P450
VVALTLLPARSSAAEMVVELFILAVPIVPLVRLYFDAGVRRRFHAFPRMQLAMAAAIATYAAVVIAAALLSPLALRALAILAAVWIVVERWQSRASFGKGRGLPPGSLAVMPAGPWQNPRYFFEQADAHGDVFKFRHFVYPAVGIANLDKAADFLKANQSSMVVPPAPFDSVVPGGFIRYAGGQKHADVAGVMRSVVTAPVVEAADAAIRDEVSRALMTFASGDDAVPLEVADRMVRNIMMRCFFGIGRGERLDRIDGHYMRGDYRQLARIGRENTAKEIFAIIREVRAIAAGIEDDPAVARPSFLSELARLHPDLITSDEILGNLVYMLHTARLDVGGLMVWLLFRLATERECTDRVSELLRNDRDTESRVGGAADRFVRETLRMHQSEFLLRRLSKPVQWNGYTIGAGWYVRICVQEGHRSVASFERPEVFDPDRFLNPPNKLRYSPFGMSPRLCPGEHLSRMIGAILVAEAAGSYRVSIGRDAPQEFSGFHWRPGPAMRISMEKRA